MSLRATGPAAGSPIPALLEDTLLEAPQHLSALSGADESKFAVRLPLSTSRLPTLRGVRTETVRPLVARVHLRDMQASHERSDP